MAIVVYGEYQDGKEVKEIDVVGNKATFIIPDDILTVKKCDLRLNRKTAVFSDTSSVISGIMLNAGDTALPWEPYTGATSSPSPEYPQDIQGVGVRTNNEPYGYRTDVVCRTEDDTESYTAPIYTQSPVYQGDKIEYRNGEYGLVRKNGLLTDNGALAWTKYTGGGSLGVNRCFRISVPDMINYPDSVVAANAKLDLLCNRLPSGVFVGQDKPVSVGYSDKQFIYIRLDDDKYADIDTVDQFRAWLADHPVEILYPLDREVWEPLPAISQQALRNLPTYKGTTIIDTTDPLEPEITVSYRPQTDYSKLPGLEVDYEKCTTTRLGAAKNLTAGSQFNRFPMYGNRRRCNVLDDGTIAAYYGDPTYTEDGSNGQVMVYQPKFYYQVVPLKTDPQTDGIGYHLRRAQYWVSHKPQPGFKLHPAFINAEGMEVDYVLLSAYEGSLYDVSAATYIMDDAQVMDVAADKLCSIAGAKPASGKIQQLTRPHVEQLARNRGPGWHSDNIKAVSANQLLMIIELGRMNTQAAIGRGVVSIPDTPNTENNSIITGSTSSLGSNTGMADGTNGKVSVSYRGVENPWGNIWKFVYGVNIHGNGSQGGGIPYICKDYNYAESKNSDNYESAGFMVANANGYISAIGYSELYDWLFFPAETLGNSSLPVGDYFYATPNLNGYRIALLGGSWYVGGDAGGFFWALHYGVGGRFRYLGGRLIYVPQ
ncbi:hypothetical protein GKG41_06725 [Lactonifactor sp. BIOML-A5]|uniref:hypothetical protein n=1 Tax=unclassified Lactonifactor TaxID=2636670 RepID=UPI0012AF1B41|nr:MULTISPECIES: hypothetical protein [unclassified Lactonifactor]MSA01023.1 hypothetical protein [Lactonifactor sp. BIOML-A5]MSB69681.1 hypothetical protein [Lactonifactor sp. BIOML-A7]